MSSIKPYISPSQEYGAEEVSGGFVIACSNSADLLEFEAVSYTHLDVYKRQAITCWLRCIR